MNDIINREGENCRRNNILLL